MINLYYPLFIFHRREHPWRGHIWRNTCSVPLHHFPPYTHFLKKGGEVNLIGYILVYFGEHFLATRMIPLGRQCGCWISCYFLFSLKSVCPGMHWIDGFPLSMKWTHRTGFPVRGRHQIFSTYSDCDWWMSHVLLPYMGEKIGHSDWPQVSVACFGTLW